MSSETRVVLIGARGAGKSTVGWILARRLRVPFFDADDEVERETGQGIAELMRLGEFRWREARVLARLLAGPPPVVAAGGGAVLWDGFERAAGGWRVIWLDAAPEVLSLRIGKDARERPSLTGRPPEHEIADVVAERSPRYESLAWKRVDTGGREAETVADEIERLLQG